MNELKQRLEEPFKNYLPIIKNVGFNPCPVNNKIPDFANSILFPENVGTGLYVEWWEEQIYRCLNGYKTGGLDLPGPYYEYLNFSTIDGPRGPITPYFVDMQYQIAHAVHQAKLAHLPGVIIPKKRRAGLSFLGVMYVNHGIRFIDRYRAGIAAGLEAYCDGFRLKLYRTYNITAPEFAINHLIRSDNHFKIGYEERTLQGFQEKIYAEVFFKTMKDKAEKMEGEYFNDVFLEESGQFPLVGDVRESILPALKDGEQFIGFMFIYGTGGEMQKSSKQFKGLWHSADILDIMKIFIPGKRYYVPYVRREEGECITPNLDKDYPDLKPEQLLGCEDVDAADESINRSLAEYAKLPEKKTYIKFKQGYPKTVEDVFTSSGTNHFNTEKLYNQSYEIESSDRKHSEWILDFVKDNTGDIVRPFQVTRDIPKKSTPEWKKVKLIKFPQPDIRDLDVAGVDGYNEDKTDTTKSLGAYVILRQYNKFPFLNDAKDNPGIMPIALYYGRPPVKELFWEIGLQLSVMYNLVGNTMISAESDAMIQYYKTEGAAKFLSRRPKSFDAPNSKLNHDFGVKMTQSSKPKMLGLVQSWVESYIQYCWFIEIINDCIAYDFAQIGTDWDSTDAVGNALMRIIDMNKKIQVSATPTIQLHNIGLPSYEEWDGEIIRVP